MADWQSYSSYQEHHTVVGDLRVWPRFHSKELNNKRDLFVWLPPSYESADATGRRYPVLYMQDGQNLFDAHISFAGEWGVDETLTALALEGHEAIVVGIPNTGPSRMMEYNPYPPSLGEAYLRFLTQTVKPLIDADFRTDPSPEATGIIGSSLGALIAFYGFLAHQDVFGFCGAFSPAFWVGRGQVIRTIENNANGFGRVYLDIGTEELGPAPQSPVKKVGEAPNGGRNDRYVRGIRRHRDRLLAHGYTDGKNLMYVEDEGAGHNEAAWAHRLPNALRFLLPPAQDHRPANDENTTA